MEEFSQLFCGVAHWHSEPEHSGSPAAGASRSAKSQGVTQSFPRFVQTWQRVPGKHCRSHYLALWTVSQKYIFSHYSSILYLQSREESPNQRMPVSRGIVMTHECTLSSLVRTVEPWSGFQLSAALPSLSNITKPHRAPGPHPWMRSGTCPGVWLVWRTCWPLFCHSCFCFFTDCDDLYVSLLTSSQLIQFNSFCFHK